MAPPRPKKEPDSSRRRDLEVEVAVQGVQLDSIVEDVKQIRIAQAESHAKLDGAMKDSLREVRAENKAAVDELAKKVTWVQITMVGLLASVTGTALLLSFNMLTK